MFARQSQSVGVNFSTPKVESTSLVMMDYETGLLIGLDLNGGLHNEIAKFSKSFGRIISVSGNLYLIHSHSHVRGRDFEVYEFNKLENWKLRSKTQFHHWMETVQFRSKIYLVGEKSMDCYDPVGNRWEKDLPGCGNIDFCLAGTRDFLYALGGRDSNRAVRFDPESSKWTEICSMKQRRSHAAATWYRENIWVAGGTCDFCIYLSCVECFDPATNSWQPVACMRNMRFDFILVVYNDELYTLGGACDEDGDRLSKDSIEVYDEDSKKWRVVEEINQPKGFISSCICDTTLIQRHK